MERKRLTKREREERNRVAAEVLRNAEPKRRIIVDCSFGHIMTDFERSSLVIQLQQCYSHLRNSGSGDVRMLVAACDDSLREKIDKQGGNQWVVDFSQHPLEVLIGDLGIDEDSVIVMSPDAETELSVDEARAEGNMFVIGGIVDRLVSRNETSHKALKLGLKARKLPLDPDRFVNKVFNIDSVFDFLLKCRSVESRDDMVDVLLKVLPERKKRDSLTPVVVKKVKASNGPVVDPCNTIKLDRYRIVELFQ